VKKSIWQAAVESPNGIKVRSNDVERLLAMLYRSQERDKSIMIKRSPDDPSEIWLVKKAQDAPQKI
jgi:hypothetical protein